jgi:hypothetical protein
MSPTCQWLITSSKEFIFFWITLPPFCWNLNNVSNYLTIC